MAYKKLKIICDADDVLISCNAYTSSLSFPFDSGRS